MVYSILRIKLYSDLSNGYGHEVSFTHEPPGPGLGKTLKILHRLVPMKIEFEPNPVGAKVDRSRMLLVKNFTRQKLVIVFFQSEFVTSLVCHSSELSVPIY